MNSLHSSFRRNVNKFYRYISNSRSINISGNSIKSAGVIVGLPESHIENVLLENVNITAEQGGLEIRNAKGVVFKNVKITTKKGNPFTVKDAEVTGLEPAVK